MRYPSVKTLLELTGGDRSIALAVRKVLDGRTRTPRDGELEAVSDLIGGYGVEHVLYDCVDSSESFYAEGFLYVNTGDTYNVTLALVENSDTPFRVTTWGDLVEAHERRCPDCRARRRHERQAERRKQRETEDMRKNIQKVIAAFLMQKPAKGDSKGSCSTDGHRILSYAVEIATRNEDGTVWIAEVGGSVTTRSQIRACWSEMMALTRCQDPTHPDCQASPEMARECAIFTRKTLRERGAA